MSDAARTRPAPGGPPSEERKREPLSVPETHMLVALAADSDEAARKGEFSQRTGTVNRPSRSWGRLRRAGVTAAWPRR